MKYSTLLYLIIFLFCKIFCFGQNEVIIPNCDKLEAIECLRFLDSIELQIPIENDSLFHSWNTQKLNAAYTLGDTRLIGQQEKILTDYYYKKDLLKDLIKVSTRYIYFLMDSGDIVSCEKELRSLEKEITKHPDFGNQEEYYLSSVWGNFYEEIQNHEESLKKRIFQLNLAKKLYPSNSLEVAHAYTNVGITYSTLGVLEKAVEYQQIGYSISSQIVPDTDYSILLDLYNLGALNYRLENNEKALEYFSKVTKTLEKQNDKSSLMYKFACNGLGGTLNRLERYEDAYNIYNNIIADIDSIGIASPLELLVRANLGVTSNNFGKINLAHDEFVKFLKKYIQFFKYNTEILTQDELINSFKDLERDVSRAALFCLNANVSNNKLPSLIYEVLLMEKGYGLEREIKINKTLKNSSGKFNDKYRNWKELRVNLKNAYDSKLADEIEIAENKFEELNKELLVLGFSKEMNDSWVKVKDIQDHLLEDEVAIEFYKVSEELNFTNANADENVKSYIAFLAKKNEVFAIPLFNEEQIINAFKNSDRKAIFVNNLYTNVDRGVITDGLDINLYNLIVAPLLPHLDNVKTIYYSPEGLLHRINFAAININEEHVFGDIYNVHLMGSTRNILEKVQYNPSLEKDAVLVGGLDFGLEEIISNDLESRIKEVFTWKNLSNTYREVEEIKNSLEMNNYEVETLKGDQGKEHDFYSVIQHGAPKILHFATHGFFIGDADSTNTQFVNIKNPMMRSGLILSNGNFGWNGINDDYGEDNILMAEEILGLDLSDTELVVLSACESGLGDISNLEGVFGLQRAFKIAGARYIIMSLWKVPDRQTREFMKTLYKNILGEKLAIKDAFIKTQREMKERFIDPYSWAGFVLIE